MSVFALLLLLTPLATQASKGLLGVCVIHDLILPHGPDSADLSQTVCHLIEESGYPLSCDDLSTMTGEQFMETVYIDEQAQFCEENAALISGVVDGGVVDGSNPDTVLVLNAMVMEALAVVNSHMSVENGERRQLFISLEDVGRAIEGAFTALWEFDPILCIMVVMVGVTAITAAAVYAIMFMGRRRRALTAPEPTTQVVSISANDIIMECATLGSASSFLCELPLTDVLALFTTGVCANTFGLQCVLSQETLLALSESIVPAS